MGEVLKDNTGQTTSPETHESCCRQCGDPAAACPGPAREAVVCLRVLLQRHRQTLAHAQRAEGVPGACGHLQGHQAGTPGAGHHPSLPGQASQAVPQLPAPGVLLTTQADRWKLCSCEIGKSENASVWSWGFGGTFSNYRVECTLLQLQLEEDSGLTALLALITEVSSCAGEDKIGSLEGGGAGKVRKSGPGSGVAGCLPSPAAGWTEGGGSPSHHTPAA